jgi:undecaprenyl-diphosphatase
VNRPADPATRVLTHLGFGVLVVVAVGIALGLLVGRVWASEVLTLIDRPVTEALVETREPLLTRVMRAISWLGGTVFVTVVLATAAVVSYLKTSRRRWPAFLAATIVGAVALDNFVKYVINRPRPNFMPLTHPFGSSFPSGHSAAAAALCFSLAYLLVQGRGRTARVWIWSFAGLIVALVAVSRIYLGVHWLTDVIGGAALGGFWTSVTAGATKFAPDGPVTTAPARAEPVSSGG